MGLFYPPFENYNIISSYTNQILREYYQMIEKDLLKIINSPSTINSIIKYYNVAHDERGCHYIIFNKEIIIRKYDNAKDWWYRKMRIDVYEQMAFRSIIHTPSLIAPSFLK